MEPVTWHRLFPWVVCVVFTCEDFIVWVLDQWFSVYFRIYFLTLKHVKYFLLCNSLPSYRLCCWFISREKFKLLPLLNYGSRFSFLIVWIELLNIFIRKNRMNPQLLSISRNDGRIKKNQSIIHAFISRGQHRQRLSHFQTWFTIKYERNYTSTWH